MNSKEFVIWLKGFTEGVHEFNVTPKQWDYLKEKLSQVKDGIEVGTESYNNTNSTAGDTNFFYKVNSIKND